jgi:hypothetical protein
MVNMEDFAIRPALHEDLVMFCKPEDASTGLYKRRTCHMAGMPG